MSADIDPNYLFRRNPHFPIAQAFSKMPAHLNPIANPAAVANLPAHLVPAAQAIAADPALSAVATNSTTNGGAPAPVTMTADPKLAGNLEERRLPSVRHQLCGMAPAVFAGAGSLSGVFTPQTRFKGNRLVVPSSTIAGVLLSNMLVGTKPQYAAASSEPSDMFEEQSTGGVWDMDLCDVGQKIQATITAPGACTVYGCIVGSAVDGKPYPRLQSTMKRIGFRQAAVAAGATFSLAITPQVRFKTRRIILDDATAKYFIINSFNIGITPQFISGDPVPAAAFTEIAQDMWLDCDVAYIGNQLTLNCTNIDVAVRDFGGALLGDVDPRDLAGGAQAAYSYGA